MPKPLDPHLRARVLADLITGSGIREVARRYDIAPSAASALGREAAVRTQNNAELERVVLAQTEQALYALAALTHLFRDPEWLSQQDAHGAAILYGVLHDKTVRVLSALGRSAAVDVGALGGAGGRALSPSDGRSGAAGPGDDAGA